MSATFLFLPGGDAGLRWARVDGGRLEEGDGAPPDDGPVIAVAPADAVTLHWAEIPARSEAQAAAAARLLAADASAAPTGELHVAVARGDPAEGAERAIGVVGAGRMRDWLAELARLGVDPVALVPAPMLIPAPASGYARAELGGRGVVRGPGAGFADEPPLTALVTGDAPPVELDRAEVADALAASAAAPALDLRQGPFARRRRRAGVDWPLVRRLGRLALAILAVTLLTSLVQLVRYSLAADALEARADLAARRGLARGETVTDADRQLTERLGRLRGPGQGFSATAAAVAGAVAGVPGTELTSLAFEEDGSLVVGVSADREAAVTDLRDAIRRTGLSAEAGVFQSAGGRVTGQFTVRPR